MYRSSPYSSPLSISLAHDTRRPQRRRRWEEGGAGAGEEFKEDEAMVVRIRLARFGCRNRPFYRVMAADSRSPRDGKHLEVLGYYNPLPG